MTATLTETPAGDPTGTLTGIIDGPQVQFARGRSVLARFGYRHVEGGEGRADCAEMWSQMWALLRGDFALPGGAPVPAYADLDPACQVLARDYMARRLVADRNLERCEQRHADIYAGGITTEAVERYAVARDAYEDSVEAFGDARDRLNVALTAE